MDPDGTPPVEPTNASPAPASATAPWWPFPAAFAVLGSLSLLIYTLASPLVRGTVIEIDTTTWGHADRERFVSAVMLWGSLALGACIAAFVVIWFAWRQLVEARHRWALGAGVALATTAIFLVDPGASYLDRLRLHEHGLIAFDLAIFTRWFNALSGATVASLFAAGAAIVIRLRDAPTHAEAAAERFRTLLVSGAAATVLGVLSIGAVHRLGGAAVSGPSASDADRAPITRALRATLAEPSPVDAEHPALGPVKRWIADRARVSEEDAGLLAERLRMTAADDPDFQRWFFSQRAEEGRQALAKSLDGIATAVASWWGVVFTTSLVLVYFLGVVAIAPAGERKGAMGLAMTDQGGQASRWVVLIRVATALAPILAAGLAEAIQKILSLFAGE